MVANPQSDPCTHPSTAVHTAVGPVGEQYYICDACGETFTPEMLEAAQDIEWGALEPEDPSTTGESPPGD